MDWHNKWAQSKKGRAMFNFVTAPNKNDPINSLPRNEQVSIFRLRTTHTPLNAHLNKILKEHLPNCNLCNHIKEDGPTFPVGICTFKSPFNILIPSTYPTLYLHEGWHYACRYGLAVVS